MGIRRDHRADEMFKKMCKKFKSKKQVWIAHFQYLLKGSRHEEAHALLKRSLQSLPEYKHVDVMQKFAQMEFQFELGSPDVAVLFSMRYSRSTQSVWFVVC